MNRKAIDHKQLIQYCRDNPRKTAAETAAHFNCSADSVFRILRTGGVKRAKRKPIKKHYNPNPVTMLTKTIVCRYHYEGDSPERIAQLLQRRPCEIKDILRSCRESGDYIKFNYFGRDKDAVRRKCAKMDRS